MKTKFDFKKILSKIKIEYLIVAALAIVAIFIFVSSFSKEENSTQTVDNYVETQEVKLKNCLSKVSGAGKVEVIISIDSGMTSILATEKQTISGKEVETPIVVNGKTVVLKEDYPEIVGVVIVSEGAKNLSVKIALLNATCVFLDIPETKVEILAMK